MSRHARGIALVALLIVGCTGFDLAEPSQDIESGDAGSESNTRSATCAPGSLDTTFATGGRLIDVFGQDSIPINAVVSSIRPTARVALPRWMDWLPAPWSFFRMDA